MCIILDANMLSRFKKRADEDIKALCGTGYITEMER